MANTVFMLGAGASKQAGTPLMADFLDVAHDLWMNSAVDNYARNFAYVFQGRSILQSIHSKSQLDIHNIESVFSAFEMAKTINKFADYKPDDIDFLVKSMKSVIMATIQETFRLPVLGPNEGIKPPSPYLEFADLIARIRKDAHPRQSVAVITFNYDMALDLAFQYTGTDIKYGLQDGEAKDALPVLKLHGSLNWAQCAVDKTVVPWKLSDYFKTHFRDYQIASGRPNPGYITFNIGSEIRELKHENHGVLEEPMIVPPTWNKSEYYNTLSHVWSAAAQELSDAENIFIVGYSLPPSDTFFRLLYGLGTLSGAPLRRIWIYNPDTSGEVESRFKELLGSGAIQRFAYKPLPFFAAVIDIRDTFFLPSESPQIFLS